MGAFTVASLPSQLSFTGVYQYEFGIIEAVSHGVYGHTPLAKLPRKLEIAVDIGAHIGTVAIPLAKLGAVVYCYEPSPFTLEFLIENVRMNGVTDRVFIHDEAATADGRDIELRLHNLDLVQTGMTSGCYDPDSKEAGQRFFVKSIPVNDALARVNGFIDFLKIDIEGMEHEVVPAISDANWARIGMIDLEVHHFNHAPYFGTEVQLGELLMAKGFERVADTEDCGWVRVS